MKKSELILSGIGGQGVILLGKMMCLAASKKGFHVTMAPAYGQEKRGGRTSCQVVISEEVGSPVISEADTILVMDEDSLKDYESRVKPNGRLIINSSMITSEVKRNDIQVIKIPASHIANDVGNAKSSNMVVLGMIVKTLDIITLDDLIAIMKTSLKKNIVDVNIKALEAGYSYTN